MQGTVAQQIREDDNHPRMHVHGKYEGSTAYVFARKLGLGGQRVEHHTKCLSLLDALHRVHYDYGRRKREMSKIIDPREIAGRSNLLLVCPRG